MQAARPQCGPGRGPGRPRRSLLPGRGHGAAAAGAQRTGPTAAILTASLEWFLDLGRASTMRPTPPRRCPDRASRGRAGLAGRSAAVRVQAAAAGAAYDVASPCGAAGHRPVGYGSGVVPARPNANLRPLARTCPAWRPSCRRLWACHLTVPCGKPRAMSASARSSLALP